MNAHAQRQYEFDGSADTAADDASADHEAREAALLADADRLKDLDVIASEELDGDTCTEMFVVLADLSDTGTVQKIAQGDAHLLSARQADTFARFARLADRMAIERAAAIAAELAS